MWYPEKGAPRPFPWRGNDTGEHAPDSVDCTCWKSPGPVGLVSNQGSVYPALGPFHVIASL